MFDRTSGYGTRGFLRRRAASTRKPARFIVHAAAGNSSAHRGVRARDSDPIAGSPVEVRISHQDHPQPQSLFGCRHLVLVTTTRRVTAEARLHPAPVSPVTVNSGGRGLACDTTLTVGARRARLITWVGGDGDYAALSLGDVSGAHDVPVRAVEERRWCSSREVTACWRRKFSLRLPLALLGDVSLIASYALAVRFGTCSC